MASKIDELFWDLSFKVDDRKLQKAQQETKNFNRLVTQGQDDLERFGAVGGASLRALDRELREAGEGAEQLSREARTTKREVRDLGQEGKRSGAAMAAAFRNAKIAFTAVAGAVATGGLLTLLRDSARRGIELAQSFLKLRASAKLFGVEQAELNALAERGKDEFRLTISEANELAVSLTKLASRAGDTQRAQEALGAALDLGAAQGLSAREVAVSLEQALRGLDEGTDKLLQKNPSQIFDDYARSIGTSAAKLTDAEQKQALLNAVIEAGSRVTGEYNRFLESNIGELSTWERMIQAAREEIGTAMLPVLAELVDVLEGPLRTGVDVLVGLFGAIESLTTDPLERLVDRLREAGDETGRLAELQLQLQQIQLQNERIQNRRAQQRERLTPRDVGGVEIPGQPVTEERQVGRREAGLTATATVAFDVSDVSTERLRRTLDDLIGAQGEIADRVNRALDEGNQAAAENLALQEERARKLAEELGTILERRQRQREIERELKENAETLAELRRKEFDLTPGSGGSEGGGPRGTPGPDPTELSESEKAARQMVATLEVLIARGVELDGVFSDLEIVPPDLEESLERLADVEFGPAGAEAADTLANRLERLRSELERLQAAEGSAESESVQLKRVMDQVGLSFEDLSAALRAIIIQTVGYENAVKSGIIEPSEEAEEAVEDLSDTFAEIEEAARGVLGLADAMGVLDDQTRQTLQGVVDLASAAQSIAQGVTTGNLLQAAGGVAQVIGGLFGGESGTERREAARSDVARQNTAALERLTNNLDRLISAISSLPGELIARGRTLDQLEVPRASGNLASGAVKDLFGDQFVSQLDALGLSISDLERLAGATGVSIDNLVAILRDDFAEGSIPAAIEEFEDLQIAIDKLELERLTETFEGAFEILQREFDLFDIEDPIEQLRRMRALFLEFVELPDDVEATLENVDLSTPEGRAEFERIIQRIFRGITSGEITAEDLGDLSVSEFLDMLGQMEGLVDEAAEAAEGGAGGFQVDVGITELRGSRIEAILTTISFQKDQELGLLSDILVELGGVARPPPTTGLTPPPPPSAVQGEAGAVQGQTATGTTTIDVGGVGPITIEVADASRESAQRIVDRIADELERELASRQIDEKRLKGRL